MTTQNDKKYQFRGGGGGQIIIWESWESGGGGGVCHLIIPRHTEIFVL